MYATISRNWKIMFNKIWLNAHTKSTSSYILSKEQLNFYNGNGFLVIKGLIDFASLNNFKKRFINIAEDLDDKGYISVVRDPALLAKGAKGEDAINKPIINPLLNIGLPHRLPHKFVTLILGEFAIVATLGRQFQDIHFDDVFSTYCENRKMLDIISQVIGDSISVMHSMFINKPSGTGRHPPHQDLYYFPFRPADKIVAAWTAVDHVNEENGCLYVIPKSHKKQTINAHRSPPDSNKIYHEVEDESLAAEHYRVPLTMQPGDTALFHPLLLHGSGPNVSKGYRKSISCHYVSGECHYVPVEGTMYESFAREVDDQFRRGKLRHSFKDMWQYKIKLVRGVKLNLQNV